MKCVLKVIDISLYIFKRDCTRDIHLLLWNMCFYCVFFNRVLCPYQSTLSISHFKKPWTCVWGQRLCILWGTLRWVLKIKGDNQINIENSHRSYDHFGPWVYSTGSLVIAFVRLCVRPSVSPSVCPSLNILRDC